MRSQTTRFFIGLLLCPFLTHCSISTAAVSQPDPACLDEAQYQSFDGDRFPYSKWLPKEEPKLVIIGIHGISGAALDYKPLANHILAKLPRTAVYAPETRGQGNDPIKERRGHIQSRDQWFRDLFTFTQLVRKRHPEAKIVWCGESMGSLIVLHSYAHAVATKQQSCDAIVLSSPITDIRRDFPQWKEYAAHLLATLFPKVRISLEDLSGNNEARVTKDSIHQDQVTQNPYHIKKHTLHLLSTLGKMIRSSKMAALNIQVPILILHGGNDIFSDPNDVKALVKKIPVGTKTTRKFYPESFHLLFYDHQSDQVVRDIADWLRQLR